MWIVDTGDKRCGPVVVFYCQSEASKLAEETGGKVLELVPKQAEREPLTDEQIDAIANSILTADPVQWWRRIARGVQEALAEKWGVKLQAHGIGKDQS
jgi:hypothetical protein